MPYVNVKVTREGTAPGASSTTPEQKAALRIMPTNLSLDVRLRARIQRSTLWVSTNGGVLVSTEGLRTGSHAEDDSLASLKIESKN